MLELRGTSVVLLLLLTCAALLSAVRAGGQDKGQSSSPGPIALIAVLPLEGPPDEGVSRVLASVVRLELESRGMQTIFLASTEEEALVRDLLEGQPPRAEVLLRGLLGFSGTADRDFLLLAGYTKRGLEIQVDFGVAETAGGSTLGVASVRATIDFQLDDILIGALRRLLVPAEEEIAEAAQRRAEQAAASPPGEEGGQGGRKPAGSWDSEAADISRRNGSRFRRLEFSIGFAPFVPLGEANATLGLGFMPFTYLDYRIPTASGILGIGLYSGLTLFTADESGLASYFKYVVPIGADVRFSGPEALRLGMFVRGGLGVGINASSFAKLPVDLRGDLGRVLPYLYGGIGASLGFSEGVGLAMDVLYQTYAYLWQEGGGLNADWIMGLVPSLYLYTRL